MRWKVGENWKPQYHCHVPWPHHPSESELDLFIVSECVRSRIMQGHGPVTHWGSWFCSRTEVKRPGAGLHPQHRFGSRSICIPLPRTAGFGCHFQSPAHAAAPNTAQLPSSLQLSTRCWQGWHSPGSRPFHAGVFTLQVCCRPQWAARAGGWVCARGGNNSSTGQPLLWALQYSQLES